MKLKFLCMLLLGSIMTMTAQNPGSITGKVIDATTKEALPYVSIVVKENGTVVGGGITEDNGTFAVKNLPLKTYSIEVQFMGYKTQTLPAALSESQRTLSLGTVSIKEEATTLDEVSIVKEVSTIEQKLDRKVITVGRDLTTAGGTASEIMNNIPSVNVDQDGNISLRGNTNVRVLVDGRPTNLDPAQLLKQIPSTSIKKIELITNPSAKYNPEGMSGIINIVLHKNANDGFNGSFNAGLTFGETPKVNNSIDMNYRTGKVNFFGTAGSNSGKYFNGGYVNRLDIDSKQLIDVVNDNESVLGKFGIDYYINDSNTLSVYTNQNYGSGKATIGTDIKYGPEENMPNINQFSKLDSDNHNNSYNLAFKHKFEKEGHTLDFEGNYNDSKDTQHVDYATTTANELRLYNDDVIDKRQNATFNLDYINPLDDKSTLELGAEARLIRSDNNYNSTNTQIPEDQRNVGYTYDQDIYSAYATFGQKFEKFSYQLGARFESYKVNANYNGASAFKDDYITVYPSAYLTYSLNDKNTLQLSYSRRVDRPSLDQTKPIREFATPLVTSLGNPELKPQFTNSVEFNYTKMFGQGSSITGGVFYRLINDEISRVLYPNESTENTQDQIMSYANFNHNNAFGFEVSANYKILKWWDIQPAIDFSSISQKGVVNIEQTDGSFITEVKSITANAFNARLNSNFKVNNRFSLNLFGFYRGAVNGVQNDSRDMYKIDSGARYTLLDNKMTLSVRFSDMFKTMRYGFDSRNPFPQEGEFRWESRTVYVGINYMFGGGKNRAMQRKQRDDNTKQGSGGMF
ncbi:outer membrane beta-barrel family protein [Flavobacterium sp. DG1-102-2]|uniref:outer membrane beta-barrel family protein n=1 Tax=Flavobacterium sp. DG1-102-2 TaxID=3081663 RepID=UPI00294941DC|nr:outer membrane beta-barrel family protein [Flavobacterium sp. DG1-102-2]MDV6169903.1 outer membrane beta-barrel family protein [Flavobacterium sp. DG1-102-2]